ncbi:hypothetical protein HanXRQr2_Chr17g0803401 [Helianthus annuus]|uniref:Uncharacterized protein n=1 Tax=Helianthus annuus TaxID=4232 RepID=A0A251RUD7_HELAN|nr:hypothetical protein HanXRQr2_Chr17g0803401 [Helianthus annuus]KAJ0813215.1 hypothetical protein HanPSC8_Chr17g0770881 [Helianthus annuus]
MPSQNFWSRSDHLLCVTSFTNSGGATLSLKKHADNNVEASRMPANVSINSIDNHHRLATQLLFP